MEPERLELPGTALDAPISMRSVHASLLAARAGAELRAPDALTSLVLEGIGLEMLAELSRSVMRESRRHPRWVEDTASRIRDDFTRGPRVTDLAEAAGVHPAHLAQRFRARYGCSIGEFLRGVRVEFACRELRETKRSLTEIALAGGFYDQSHFSTIFKRAIGRTPGEYRRLFTRWLLGQGDGPTTSPACVTPWFGEPNASGRGPSEESPDRRSSLDPSARRTVDCNYSDDLLK